MAALAYLFPPVSGAIAFFAGSPRARAHGFQAALFGALWPALLYLCSFVSTSATQIAFVLGVLIWLLLILATALGRDPIIPPLGAWVSRRGA